MKKIPWLLDWVRDAGVLLVAQGTVLAATWILSILVARELGPAQFGTFAACFGIAQVVSILVDAGLGNSTLRELSLLQADAEPAPWGAPVSEARAHEAARTGWEVISSAMAMTFALTAALMCLASVVGLVAGFEREIVAALGALVGYTGLAATARVAETAFRARREVRRVAAATAVDKTTLAIGVTVTLLVDGGIGGVAVSYLAAGVARLAFDAAYGAAVGSLRLVRPRVATAKESIRRAVPFAISAGATVLAMRLDAVVIAAAASATAAGFYAIGDRILLMLLFIPLAASSSLYPFLSRDQEPGTAVRVSFILGALSAAAAVGLAMVAPWFVPAIFGPQYEEAVFTVQVMGFALPFVAIGNGMTVALFTKRRERLVLVATAPSMLAGTLGIAVAAATHGINGAAIAYVARAGLTTSLLVIAGRREHAGSGAPEPEASKAARR